MQRDDLVYVGHMLETAREAVALIQGKSRADYDQDRVLRLALAQLVQRIGEAARRVSPAFSSAYPEVPWRAIVGMRHKVVHDYLNLDEDILWDTVVKDLPPLIAQLEPLVLSE